MKKDSREKLIWCIIILGLLLRLGYVLYTPYTMGQHDTMELGSGQGHFGYIEYFLEGGTLPFDFNPMYAYQFYHPPLFHLLAALFVRVNLALGVEYVQAFENLQFLTLVFSAVTLLLFVQIFREIGLKGRGLLAAAMLAAFHPAFYLLAGSINNDGLCLLFMAAAILLTLRWYRRRGWKEILLLALAVVGGVLTKANAFLITPAIALIFLWVLLESWKDSAARRHIICQLAVFAVLAVPLGLSWSVWNYLRYGMAFDFTPAALTVGSTQSVSDYTVWERLTGLKDGPLLSLSLRIHEDQKDYNIWIALLKTAVFGEYTLMSWGLAYRLLQALTLVNAVLAAGSVPLIAWFGVRRGEQRKFRLFFLVLYLIQMVFYLRFCFQYQKVCSMDFRYITLTAIVGAAAYGWLAQEKPGSLISRAAQALIVVWSALSVLAYLALGVTPRAW